jgi:hypothetical protein
VADLRGVIQTLYDKIGPELTAADRHAGEAWLMYRIVELGLARYRKSPRAWASFTWRNRSGLRLSPAVLLATAATLLRRTRTGDVQRTVRGPL